MDVDTYDGTMHGVMPTRDPKKAERCCPSPRVQRPEGSGLRARSAALFRVLADPTRLEVLALISAQHDAICVCDIVECFEVSQPTISHHLKLLREAHLVRATRRGTWSFYSVDPRAAALVNAALGSVLGSPLAAVDAAPPGD